ncbi:MAG: response regulator [Alphaproteobacteria bacterium]|nr:response regulator [Alphaproteobacteria bacterium]
MSVILIVEDETFIRELAAMVVEDWGDQVLTASDVDGALEILRSPVQIDLLFTDIYLKTAVFGGCDLAREAVLIRPNLRVLYTTGNSATEKLKALFVTGSHFLGKPYTPHQLQGSVESLFAALA